MESNELPRLKNTEPLVNSKEIIFSLLKGHHIFDGPMFSEIKSNESFYSDFFNLMELELCCHEREFYFLTNSDSNIGKNASGIAVLFFVFLRAISTRENNPRPNIFRTSGFETSLLSLENLPTNDRSILEEAGIGTSEAMDKKLASMARLGFLTLSTEEPRFVFNAPVHRLIELCESFALEDGEVEGDEEE